MPIVFLKRNWFDPDGKLWYHRDNPHEIADEQVEFLPSDAIVDGVPRNADKLDKRGKAVAKELAEAGKEQLAQKEKDEDIVRKAEADHNDAASSAVRTRTAKL